MYLELINSIEGYISSGKSMNPNKIYPQLSNTYLKNSRKQIKEFFNNESIKIICIGFSSSGTCAHLLYRDKHGIIYEVLYENNKLDCIYFTSESLNNYFDGYEEDKPDYSEPIWVAEQYYNI